MELLLKRSQASLAQIQNAMSRYFDVKKNVRGRYEWIEGELRQEPGLGRHNPEEVARMSITVPYADKEKRTFVTRLLSFFSGTLYRVRLDNIDLPTTLAIIREFQGLGADVGFVAWPVGAPGHLGNERFKWPGNPDAELSMAYELHKLYTKNLPR